MSERDSLSEIEEQYTADGQPTLGEAFRLLWEQWLAGSRDRDAALRLLFLSWYSCSEPPYLTGLDVVDDPGCTFRAVYEHLGGEQSDDREFLFVAGYMLTLDPWCAGPEEAWALRGQACLARWRQGGSILPDPTVFAGRGAYGHYFEHIARTGWSGV